MYTLRIIKNIINTMFFNQHQKKINSETIKNKNIVLELNRLLIKSNMIDYDIPSKELTNFIYKNFKHGFKYVLEKEHIDSPQTFIIVNQYDITYTNTNIITSFKEDNFSLKHAPSLIK